MNFLKTITTLNERLSCSCRGEIALYALYYAEMTSCIKSRSSPVDTLYVYTLFSIFVF